MQDDESTTARLHAQPVLPAQRLGDDDTDQPSVAHELLAEHVPLALLVDLVAPVVSSEEILATEGLPDEPWWEAEADVVAPSGAQTEPARTPVAEPERGAHDA